MARIKANNLILTVIDNNIINHTALKIMVRTMELYAKQLLPLTAVVYPAGEIQDEMIDWLSYSGLNTFSYPLANSSDPYRAKFLLNNFIIEDGHLFDLICYIDPDHLICSDFLICPTKGSMIISSEIHNLDRANSNIGKPNDRMLKLKNIHYNTSIVFGFYDDWKIVVDSWIRNYNDLDGYIQDRHREEIAFSIAAIECGINLKIAENKLQSNFNSFDYGCALFHYGGETPGARSIKQCFNKDVSLDKCLSKALVRSESQLQTWATQRILRITKEW